MAQERARDERPVDRPPYDPGARPRIDADPLRDRVGRVARHVLVGLLGAVFAGVVRRVDGAMQRVGEIRRLALLDPLEDDVVALDDVVEPQMPDRRLPCQLGGQSGAQVSRPASAGAARQRNVESDTDPP